MTEIEANECAFQVQQQKQLIEYLSQSRAKNRWLPALWALRYDDDECFQVELLLLSDLSGVCCHDPIRIAVSRDFVAKYQAWMKVQSDG